MKNLTDNTKWGEVFIWFSIKLFRLGSVFLRASNVSDIQSHAIVHLRKTFKLQIFRVFTTQNKT